MKSGFLHNALELTGSLLLCEASKLFFNCPMKTEEFLQVGKDALVSLQLNFGVVWLGFGGGFV